MLKHAKKGLNELELLSLQLNKKINDLLSIDKF